MNWISLLLVFEFSIASFFQNEAPYLKEWIDYHLQLGFEHFWLYNNNSKDNYQEVLEPYIQAGLVELKDYPSPDGQFWAAYQVGAFNDAIHQSIGKSTWLALIDIDEFIVPLQGKQDFIRILREKEQIADLGGLILFWQVFGTSNLWDIPAGKKLTESLLWRAKDDYPLNCFVKTIVRPERVERFDIHSGLYKSPFQPYTLQGPVQEEAIRFDPPILSPIRINHYWVRTLKWLYETKIPRLRQFNSNLFTQEETEQLNNSLNQVLDTAILDSNSPYPLCGLMEAKANSL